MRPSAPAPTRSLVAEPLDPAVPFAEVAAHARPGEVIGVWLAAAVPSMHPHFLIGAAGRGPRPAALLVDADLGALTRRVRSVLVVVAGRPCRVASRDLARARLLEIHLGPEIEQSPLAEATAEQILADARAAGRAVASTQVHYRFDSPPEALLG